MREHEASLSQVKAMVRLEASQRRAKANAELEAKAWAEASYQVSYLAASCLAASCLAASCLAARPSEIVANVRAAAGSERGAGAASLCEEPLLPTCALSVSGASAADVRTVSAANARAACLPHASELHGHDSTGHASADPPASGLHVTAAEAEGEAAVAAVQWPRSMAAATELPVAPLAQRSLPGTVEEAASAGAAGAGQVP